MGDLFWEHVATVSAFIGAVATLLSALKVFLPAGRPRRRGRR